MGLWGGEKCPKCGSADTVWLTSCGSEPSGYACDHCKTRFTSTAFPEHVRTQSQQGRASGADPNPPPPEQSVGYPGDAL